MSSKSLHQDRPVWGLIIRLVGIFFITTTFALVKHAVASGVHLTETLFFRYLFGSLIIGGYLLARRRKNTFKTKRLGAHFYRAMIGMASMGLNFWSFTLMPLAEASVLNFAVPSMAVILSVILLSEVVGPRRWAAVLIGFIGIIIAVRPDGASFTGLGIAVGLSAAFFAAYTGVLVRDLSKTESTETIMIYYMLLATPALVIVMFKFGQIHSAETYILLSLIGITGTIGMVVLTESIRHADVAVLVPVDYSMFIFSAIYGYFFWDTMPASTVWLGLPLIIGSGLYIGVRERLRKKESYITRG